ncbi:MAG TPA: GGDEF domain-containing protein [Polyangiaceae bacterium]|nr:GGDEF domain-containing protein [Polyangiaceae bacterium]
MAPPSSDRRFTTPAREEHSESANARIVLRSQQVVPRLTTSALAAFPSSRPARARDKMVLFVIQGHQQGEVMTVEGESVLVGRDNGAQLRLDDDTVSREHARIRVEEGQAYVEDLRSLNGTFVNERRIDAVTVVRDGDQLRFGDNTIVKFWTLDEIEHAALTTLYEHTSRDALTRLYNRRYVDERLQSEFSFARRHRVWLSILLIDIDYFKRVNDNFGHATGDAVLKSVAANLLAVTRPEDVVARYGGEEFLLIARNTSRVSATALAERVRRAVQAARIPGQTFEVTASVGVVSAGPGNFPDSPEKLLGAADDALYSAKDQGRNRVAVARPLTESDAPVSSPDTIPPGRFDPVRR